jgi:hypothetical protein
MSVFPLDNQSNACYIVNGVILWRRKLEQKHSDQKRADTDSQSLSTQTGEGGAQANDSQSGRCLIPGTGLDRFSMSRLAQEIGYSDATLYLYFRNKDDLLFTVVDKAFSKG